MQQHCWRFKFGEGTIIKDSPTASTSLKSTFPVMNRFTLKHSYTNPQPYFTCTTGQESSEYKNNAITKDGYHTPEDGSCTKQKNSIKNDTTGFTISSTVVVDTNFQKAQQRACQWASNCKECQEPEIEDDLQDHPPPQFLVNSKDFVCNACPSFYCSSSTCTLLRGDNNRVWDLYVPFLCYPLLWQPRFLWQSMMEQQ